jgi:spermidine synthase
MTRTIRWILLTALCLLTPQWTAGETVVFETTSPYHHIKVVDRGELRTLHFDNSHQSQMSLSDPLQGHFEYTEYFHMPWLWNDQIETVLMIGLGGGSIQRAYQTYWPQARTETIELDPKVVETAKKYFQFKETDRMKVFLGDGRLHVRRSQKKYDLIILDAYTANRYSSFIPYALVTKEFFKLIHTHLSDRGVLAYNVIGSVTDTRKGLVGSIYKTLKTSFPQVYMFPAEGSFNVVMVATKSPVRVTKPQLKQKLDALTAASEKTVPNLTKRLRQFRATPPSSVKRSEVLTDDFAPVDGLMRTR